MWIYKGTSTNCVTEKLLISDILILTVLFNYNRDFVIFEVFEDNVGGASRRRLFIIAPSRNPLLESRTWRANHPSMTPDDVTWRMFKLMLRDEWNKRRPNCHLHYSRYIIQREKEYSKPVLSPVQFYFWKRCEKNAYERIQSPGERERENLNGSISTRS